MGKYSKMLIPTFYLGIIAVMVMSVILVLSGISRYLNDEIDYNYTLDNVFEDNISPVVKTNSNTIIRPYISNDVKIGKYFYDFESESKEQEESIVFFENTYLQNQGVDYVCSEAFDVVSILDGVIVSVEETEIYGKIVTIEHNDNLKTVYGNLEDVLATTGYKVSQGEIIALSGSSVLNTESKSSLHFEVYYKGEAIDPENLYTLSIEDFR